MHKLKCHLSARQTWQFTLSRSVQHVSNCATQLNSKCIKIYVLVTIFENFGVTNNLFLRMMRIKHMTMRWLQLYCAILWLYLSLEVPLIRFKGQLCVTFFYNQIQHMSSGKFHGKFVIDYISTECKNEQLLRFWYMSKMS